MAFTYDTTSSVWIEPLSSLLHGLLPIEWIYSDWYLWQAKDENRRAQDKASEQEIITGSRVEGFCIPRFSFSRGCMIANQREREMLDITTEEESWRPDRDTMEERANSEATNEGRVPMFNVEHSSDERYVKLRITSKWKQLDQRFENASYLHNYYALPLKLAQLPEMRELRSMADGLGFVEGIHGPVHKTNFDHIDVEVDETSVLKYPEDWPAPAREWLERPRPNGWPSSELIQHIYEQGCHIAPVGLGKRADNEFNQRHYLQKPECANMMILQDGEGSNFMDEFLWRISFSVAENILGQSVTSIQRHTLVLMKVLKKAYFPDVISSYFLKNLLFWECETKDKSFWKEDTSAKCLLHLLDRLQECLEKGYLPHYIMPQSNLLQHEDPAKVSEAAVVVGRVRKTILSAIVVLLGHGLRSEQYFSNIFLQDLDIASLSSRIEDSSLGTTAVNELCSSINRLFVERSSKVLRNIEAVNYHYPESYENFLILKHVYESLLARNLCKLWFSETSFFRACGCGSFESDEALMDAFASFARDMKVPSNSREEIMPLLSTFFVATKDGFDATTFVPFTNAMLKVKELQKEKCLESELADPSLMPISRQDIEDAFKRAQEKMKGQTTQDVEPLFNAELEALFRRTGWNNVVEKFAVLHGEIKSMKEVKRLEEERLEELKRQSMHVTEVPTPTSGTTKKKASHCCVL